MNRAVLTVALVLAVAVVFAVALVGCTAPVGAPSQTPPASEPRWEDPPEADPTAIRITAIETASSLVALGTDPSGAIVVPDAAGQASWWTDSPRPGETGPAVILGHINNHGQPGVFARLGELRPGDVIAVEQATGNVVLFAVYKIEQWPKASFEQWRDTALGDTRAPELRLISCGGRLDPNTRSYTDNLIAYARELT